MTIPACYIGRFQELYMWWCLPTILALQRLKQEEHKFKTSLVYIARTCLREGEGEREIDRQTQIDFRINCSHLLKA
jgi:hypothetical protein